MPFCGFYCSSGPQIEIKRKRKDKLILGPRRRSEKAVEYKGHGNTNCSPQESGEGNEGTWNRWENRNNPDYSIAEIAKEYWEES